MARNATVSMMVAAVVVAVVAVVAVVDGAPRVDVGGHEGGMAAFRKSLYGQEKPDRRAKNQCSTDARQQYVCELCAKQTKSLEVYTLCCDGAQNAQTWCDKFITFGITSLRK